MFFLFPISLQRNVSVCVYVYGRSPAHEHTLRVRSPFLIFDEVRQRTDEDGKRQMKRRSLSDPVMRFARERAYRKWKTPDDVQREPLYRIKKQFRWRKYEKLASLVRPCPGRYDRVYTPIVYTYISYVSYAMPYTETLDTRSWEIRL